MRRNLAGEEGFTWVEIVILVALIGILSALSLPRLSLWRERQREEETKANLAALKAAISIYYGDHEGVWPSRLDAGDKTPGYGFGNYLENLPAVKATYPQDPAKSPAGNAVTYKAFNDEPGLGVPGSVGAGWRYDGPEQGNTGRIWVNSSLLDSRGVSYTTYGY
jgi:type II secretory pathway pseudopilin PulG